MLPICTPVPRQPAEPARFKPGTWSKPDHSSIIFFFMQHHEHIWYTTAEQHAVYVPHQPAAARDADWRGMSNAQSTRLSAFKTGRAHEKCYCKWSLAWPKSQTMPKTCLEECNWPRAKPLPGTVATKEHGQGSCVCWAFAGTSHLHGPGIRLSCPQALASSAQSQSNLNSPKADRYISMIGWRIKIQICWLQDVYLACKFLV